MTRNRWLSLLCAVLMAGLTACHHQKAPEWILSPEASQTYGLLLLDQSLKKKDSKGVLEAADALIASKSDTIPHLTQAGAMLLMNNDPVTAEVFLSKCVAAYPDELPLRLLLADALFGISMPDKAVDILRSFVEVHPETQLGRQEYGLALYRLERYEKAGRVFAAFPKELRTPCIETAYGHTLFVLKQPEEAERHLLKGIADGDSPSPGFITTLVSMMLDAKAYGTADRYMTAILKKTSMKNPRLDLFAAAAAFENGRTARALELLDRIPPDLKDAEPVHTLYAHVLNEIGYGLVERHGTAKVRAANARKALPLLTKAAELVPESPYILDSLAWAQFKAGDVRIAYVNIRKALTLPGGDKESEIWEHYAAIAESLGLEHEAGDARTKAAGLKTEKTPQPESGPNHGKDS